MVCLGGILTLSGCGSQSRQSTELIPLDRLVASAESFRREAWADPHKALTDFCEPSGRRELDAAARALGFALDPEDFVAPLGWFLGASVMALAMPDPTTQLVGYLHPWSDLVLITVWRVTGRGEAKIHRAALVPGELIREPNSAGAPDAPPRWLQSTAIPPPASLLFASHDLTQAFLANFDRAGETATAWEDVLALSGEQDAAERLGQRAGILFATQLAGALNLAQSPEDSLVRGPLLAVLRQLRTGGAASLPNPPPGLTKSFPPTSRGDEQFWREARIVACVPGLGGRVFVFVASPRQPAEFACFWFRRSADGLFAMEDVQLYSMHVSPHDLEKVRSEFAANGIQP